MANRPRKSCHVPDITIGRRGLLRRQLCGRIVCVVVDGGSESVLSGCLARVGVDL